MYFVMIEKKKKSKKASQNCNVIANFLYLGIFNENRISELRNSEILSLLAKLGNLSFIKNSELLF